MKKKKQANKFDSVYQFKITLNDSTPKIWRRVLAPKNYSFFDLHCAIQNAMGWAGGHLHGFSVSQKGNSSPLSIQLPDPDCDFGLEALDERDEKIADYFDKKVKQCQYTYDFGDGWDHTILLERELPLDLKLDYPICVAGKNTCPPDNCGGVWGYRNLLKVLKNPKDSEYADMREWLGLDDGEEYDPFEFDLDDVFFENPDAVLKDWKDGFAL